MSASGFRSGAGMDGRSVISRRIKEAREKAGISQKALGIRAGIDEFSASPRINQYERGKHLPNPSVLERLAAVLKVPVGYFYTRDDALAEILVAVERMPTSAKRQLLARLRRQPKV